MRRHHAGYAGMDLMEDPGAPVTGRFKEPRSMPTTSWTTPALAGGASWDLASESYRRQKEKERKALLRYPIGGGCDE